MAVSSIVLRIRREGDQALPQTARDLRTVATAATTTARALRSLQAIPAPSLGALTGQATALDTLARSARAAADAYRELARAAQAAGAAGAAIGAAPARQASAPAAGGATAAADSRAQREALALEQARQRLARETANTAAAEQRLARETANTAAAQSRAEAAAGRLTQQQQRLAQQTTNTARGFQILPRSIAAIEGPALAALQGVGGALAAAFGVQQLAAFTGQAVQAANQLEDVQQSLRVVAGDVATYERAIQVAQQSQRLFGGSLADNISELQGFVLTSRTAGVSLESLVTVSRQLALLDPAQGLRGASIALRELLAGNPTSLAQRFELPRATLRALTNESATTTDRLAALSRFLAEAGITAEALDGRLQNTSQTYRDLGVAADQARTSIGRLIADGLEPLARSATEGLNAVSELTNRLSGQGNQFTQAAQQAASAATSYDAYIAAIDGQNAAVQAQIVRNQQLAASYGPIATGLVPILNATLQATAGTERLSQAQFAYARALIARGQTEEQAFGAAARQRDSLLDIESALQASGGALEQYRERVIRAASASDASRDAVISLAQAYLLTRDADAFTVTLGAIEATTRRNAAATAEAARETERYASILGQSQAAVQAVAGASTTLTEEQRKQALTASDAAVQARALADANATIASIAGQVRSGLISSAEGANVLAVRFGFAADEAARLIINQNRVANLAGTRAAVADQRAGERSGGDPSAATERRAAEAARIRQEQAREAERARREQLIALGSTAQQVAARQEEYNEAVRRFGRDSAEAIRAQTALRQAQQSGARASGSTAGRGLDAGFRADLRLQEDNQGRLAQLEAERRSLEERGLTNGLRYKQVLIEIEKAQAAITEETEKAVAAELNRAQAANRAGLAAIADARERRREEQQLAAARRILDRPQFSDEQRRLAAEEIQRIDLERQRRALEIEEQRRAAGATPAAIGAGAPPPPPAGVGAVPSASVPPPPVQLGGQPLMVVLQISGQEVQRVIIPGVVAALRGGLAGAAAGG